jgi:hypothetical protein
LGRFQSLEQDPVELERAAQAIERLRGAQVELAANQPQYEAPPAPAPVPRVRGKFDAWVIGTGSVAIASFVMGTVFGVRALALSSASEAGRARDSAVIADFAFAASALAGAGSVGLYLGRYTDVPARVTLPMVMPRVSSAGLVFRF